MATKKRKVTKKSKKAVKKTTVTKRRTSKKSVPVTTGVPNDGFSAGAMGEGITDCSHEPFPGA